MSTLDAFIAGLVAVFQYPAFPLMLLGIVIGFIVGLLPGLGGATTLALMLPFIYDMPPIAAFAFLLGMHAVTSTTGDITSVLFGVPGEGTAAATIVDGHPMAKKGEAGRALGAALFSSLVGAVIGAFVLAASIPIITPLVLALGSPEFFMLAILGISFIAALSGGSLTRGLIAGCTGLLLATIGLDPRTGAMRFGFDMPYLMNGISLVPVGIGLFAIPEIIDLAVRGTSIAENNMGKLGGVWEGVKDTFRHWGVTVRSSLLGTFIGIIPGLGGGVAQWIAYGHAVQSADDKSQFGKGDVRGVLGPGAANNSKEGGSLIPTVAFAVPGSLSMAILLGAFLILGLNPGPEMLTKDLHITFSMVWVIVISNIITVLISLAFLDQLAKITTVRGVLLIPFLLMLIYLGAFATNNHIGDMLVMVLFGLLGYIMVLFHWPRPPLVLGLVLGHLAENYLFISANIYGARMMIQPGVIIISILIIAAIVYPLYQNWRAKHAENASQTSTVESEQTSPATPKSGVKFQFQPKLVVSLAFATFTAFFLWAGKDWPVEARLFPWFVAIPAFVLSLVEFGRDSTTASGAARGQILEFQFAEGIDPAVARPRMLNIMSWTLGILAGVWLVGVEITMTGMTFAYLKIQGGERWGITLILTLIAWLFVRLLFIEFMHLPFPEGKIIEGIRSLFE